jgi:hypothetical protein
VIATTLRENAAARALLRRLHFRQHSSHRHAIELELELKPHPATVVDLDQT